jgi:DNA-binding MarR family transcriptional regulator
MTPYQRGLRVLTPERVQLVRVLHDRGLCSIAHLARQCNVTEKTMARIVKRRSYRDIAERPDVLRQFAGKVVLEVEVPHGTV